MHLSSESKGTNLFWALKDEKAKLETKIVTAKCTVNNKAQHLTADKKRRRLGTTGRYVK